MQHSGISLSIITDDQRALKLLSNNRLVIARSVPHVPEFSYRITRMREHLRIAFIAMTLQDRCGDGGSFADSDGLLNNLGAPQILALNQQIAAHCDPANQKDSFRRNPSRSFTAISSRCGPS
jgi:hypothetical protein